MKAKYAAAYGLLVGAALVVLLGQGRAPAEPEVGRFQVVFSPHLRADTFLLDTSNGRVWCRFHDESRSADFWAEELVMHTDNRRMTHEEFQAIHPDKDASKPKWETKPEVK